MPIIIIIVYFYSEYFMICQNMILQLILQLIPPMQCKLWFDKSTTYLILELSENDERQGPSEVWVSKLLLFRRQGQVWERDPNPLQPPPLSWRSMTSLQTQGWNFHKVGNKNRILECQNSISTIATLIKNTLKYYRIMWYVHCRNIECW